MCSLQHMIRSTKTSDGCPEHVSGIVSSWMRDIGSRTAGRGTHGPFINFAQITRSFSRGRSSLKHSLVLSIFCVLLTGSFPKARLSRMIFMSCGPYFTGCIQKSSFHPPQNSSRMHFPSVKGWLTPTSFFMSENFSKSSCCGV